MVACGAKGTLLLSEDAGATWSAKTTGTTFDLKEVLFVNDNLGYAVGRYATLLKTDDGGNTWTKLEVNASSSDFVSIALNSAGKLFVVSTYGSILSSADEGKTFAQEGINRVKEYNDVIHLGNGNLAAVGKNGIVSTSNDFGDSWELIPVATAKELNALAYFNGDLLAVGTSSTILRSMDQGKTWQELPNAEYRELFDILFIDAQTILSVGASGTVLRSDDGGATWVKIISGVSPDLHAICFAGDSTLVAVGDDGTVIYSADKGVTWTKRTNPPSVYDFRNCSFYNAKYGIVNLNTRASVWTADSGYTWTYTSTTAIGSSILNEYSDSLNLVTYGSFGGAFTSTNSGKNWTTTVTPEKTHSFTKIIRLNASTLVAAGFYGLSKSTDNGITWDYKEKALNYHWNDVQHASEDVLYAAGNNCIYKSTDRGASWDLSLTFSTVFFTLHFFDADTGLVMGQGGYVMYTENGGKTWSSLSRMSGTPNINDVSFLDRNNGVAVGTSGSVFMTTNGGKNWTKKTFPHTYQLSGVDYVSPTKIVAVGGSRDIFVSNDAGNTWSTYVINYFSVNNFKDVDFGDENTGIAVGQTLQVYKTKDGGKSWYNIPSDPNTWFYGTGIDIGLVEVVFADPDTVYAIGGGGMIMKSTDAGETWRSIFSPATRDLREMSYYDYHNICAVGLDGTIITVASSNIVTGAEPVESKVKDSRLSCFPNPFSTEVSFTYFGDITGNTNMNTIIFDSQGKAMFEDERLISNGEVIRMILKENLAPGVYFYHCTVGDEEFKGKLIRQ